MPGRHTAAGRVRSSMRRSSLSQVEWRHVSAPEVAHAGGLEVSGGNGFIDPYIAIDKLKRHGKGLWAMQAAVALVMSSIAVITDTRYGLTHWYTNSAGGGKLREMQYAWAVFNTICAIYGVWAFMLWNEAVAGIHRDRRLFRQKVHIWLSYFTWAFGVWTTAVVFVSFKNYTYSSTAIYPTDLTCAFIGAVLCCILSDIWALGKLCSLGTYAARLEEEWRLTPHELPAPTMLSDPLQDLEEAATRGMEKENFHRVEGERAKSLGKVKTRRSSRSERRASGGGASRKQRSQKEYDQETGLHDPVGGSSFGLAVSEDEVMMPHAFERLWSALDSKGEFQTKITEMVPQTRVVRHLTDRGFQVVAAGTVGGLMRVLFCAKEATSNGTGAWFLAELLQDESDLTLEATFKSKSASAVPGFVQAFMLHHIFTMANA